MSDLRGATSDLTGGQATAAAMMAVLRPRAEGDGRPPRPRAWRAWLAGLLRRLAARLEPEQLGLPEPEWSGGTH